MKNHLFGIMLLLFLGTSYAQEKQLSLSMQAAIDYAIKNNFSARAAENDIAAAKKRKWETTTIGLPQISAKVDYQNWIKQQVSLLPAAAFDNTSAVVKTVEDYFGLVANNKPNSPEGFIPVVFGTKQNINATVTLSQLIFDGSYLVGLQSAKTYLKISEQAKEKTELSIKEAVINAYGNVLVAEKSLSILIGNKAIVEKNLNDAKKILENGMNEEEDVEQLQITLSTINSQLNRTKRLRDIGYKMLNIALGNTIDTSLVLTDSLDSLIEENIDLNLISQQFQLNDHIDFRIAENDRESKRLLMKLEQSKALPSLRAFINYGTMANSNSFSFFNSNQKWFGSSLLGVSLNIPIFSSLGRSAKTQQAKIALETADIRLEETKQKLNLAVATAKSDYQFSIEQYQTAKENLALAERIEKKQQVKFFEGISTSFDLSQAQNQLYRQQQNYVQSMLDVIAKKVKLENALSIPIK